MKVFDARPCQLGEGPLWHPLRHEIFWFDILGNRLLSRRAETVGEWHFDENVSAAGWVDRDTLLIAGETALWHFEIATGRRERILPLEAENTGTRSNDGRADPMGGFWIGTMGKGAEARAGAIYRYHRGSLERLHEAITIPNSICFAADGRAAFFADSPSGLIMRQPLDSDGWPEAQAEVFVDLSGTGIVPDGSVLDASGGLWNAQWGMGRVARYDANGRFDRAISVGARNASCPAFGGADLAMLFVTTARADLESPTGDDGVLYAVEAGTSGLPEPRVVLS